jgi:quercetin dioxygenase-like cupin family protein
MRISDVPFHVMDWATVEQTNHRGASGEASWRTRNVGPGDNPIRLRLVEYSPGYVADHWCEKGHVLFVLEGQLETRLKDGRTFTLRAGMSYAVADGAEPHLSSTATGARLFIVD